MKQADSLLLNALKAAIHNEKAALGVLPQETQTELLRRAVRHGVLPLVLDACGNALKAARRMAFCQTAEQILKTQVFSSRSQMAAFFFTEGAELWNKNDPKQEDKDK